METLNKSVLYENMNEEELQNLINSKAFQVTKQYRSGAPWDCVAKTEVLVETPFGNFKPRFEKTESRHKLYKSISFYENGVIKSITPQEQTTVKTNIGTFEAELITFHKNGSLNRIFPLNGQIDGFWTEQDEATLAKSYAFDLKVANFESKIISLQFYDTGELRGLTLWPGETINLKTPQGIAKCRIGFNLYPNGELKSFEPAEPFVLKSSIGEITAFDYDVLGIHSDRNAVSFYENGDLLYVKTPITSFIVQSANGRKRIAPKTVINPLDNESVLVIANEIHFDKAEVSINGVRYLDSEYQISAQTMMLLGSAPKGNISQIAI